MINNAVILVGGLGTRLGKITKKTPKPLIKVQKKKFLDWLILNLSKYNVKNIFLLCSYKQEIFFKNYHKKNENNINIQCINEGLPKGTGGALLKLKKKIKGDFLLLNGDTYFDLDFIDLIKQKNKKTIGAVALVKNNLHKYNNKLNNIKLDKNFLVFSKKKTNIMNGGIYFFSTKIFNYLQFKCSLEDDILPKLIKNKKIQGKIYNEKFIDIGTPNNLKKIKYDKLNFFKKKAAFLDRDGVINKKINQGYVLKKKDLKLRLGTSRAIKYLNKKKFLVIVITNQACIGKGLITEKDLEKIHYYMKSKIFELSNGIVNDIFISPYYKYSKYIKYRRKKNLRKPNPGMLKKAIKKWNIDLSKSFMIGDQNTDKIAAKKIGLKFWMFQENNLDNFIKKKINER